MADRYSYVPLIGIFLALVWLVADLAPQSQKVLVGCCSVVIIAILSAVSYRQVAVWQNSFTLFEHALTVTKDNAPALRNLGAAYQDARQPDKAIPLLEESVRLLPLDAHTWMNLGISHMTAGRGEEALAAFEKAARMKPKDSFILFNLALAYAMQQRWEGVQQVRMRLATVALELAQRLEMRLQGAQPTK